MEKFGERKPIAKKHRVKLRCVNSQNGTPLSGKSGGQFFIEQLIDQITGIKEKIDKMKNAGDYCDSCHARDIENKVLEERVKQGEIRYTEMLREMSINMNKLEKQLAEMVEDKKVMIQEVIQINDKMIKDLDEDLNGDIKSTASYSQEAFDRKVEQEVEIRVSRIVKKLLNETSNEKEKENSRKIRNFNLLNITDSEVLSNVLESTK